MSYCGKVNINTHIYMGELIVDKWTGAQLVNIWDIMAVNGTHGNGEC